MEKLLKDYKKGRHIMLDKKNRTLQMHPSLIPLRMALIAAAKESPACPPQVTTDERRALELIERMKAKYNKPLPFMFWKGIPNINRFSLQEVIGTHA